MYAQDNDERFPRFFRQGGGNPQAGGTYATGGFNPGGVYWHEAIFAYIKNTDTLLCPQSGGALNGFCLPYGWNWAYVHDNGMAEYAYPAETLLIADGRGRLTTAGDRSDCTGIKKAYPAITVCADCIDGQYLYGHGLIPPAAAANDPSQVNLEANYAVSARHFGKANIYFMDGHARALEAQEVNRCNNEWDGDGAAGSCRVGENNPRYSTAYD